ncbi:DUF262 domain-containing protein [Curtobacterium sp. 18060]|uniref:GmrSD restriction endonuclease domain-containing protein n=1 Tax=Curtobacterium sp. 18060 TaxID=2681408 RepID=UPI00135C9AB6|nr:DUF262 domain-containing protein [Curtobacterium sp. 18060]
MAELKSISIRKLLEQVGEGQVRIPAFQREFVWDADHISHFIDSIYKGYPFGSLLFWSTQQKLESDRHIGPYELPTPGEKASTTYVLDGQQRVTSLFMTFQTDFTRPESDAYPDIYFDLSAEPSAQQPQFLALHGSDVDSSAHFPLRTLFDSTAYRKATNEFDEEQLQILDDLHSRFKEAMLPVQEIETEDRGTVAIVFERINHQGVELSPIELLAAWTWRDDFDLRQKFVDLEEELELFSFGDAVVGGDLVLRSCAAILSGDPTVDSLMRAEGEVIRDAYTKVVNGIKGAVDFLNSQLNVHTVKTLPYPLMLVPLATFFAKEDGVLPRYTEAQLSQLKKWFWRSCFSERYSGQTSRAAKADVAEMASLRDGAVSEIANFGVAVGANFFLETSFRMGSARTATFVNMLASEGPYSFISGNKIDLRSVLQAYNKSEFHHIFPKAYLEELGVDGREINNLANFAFLSRDDNNKIRRKAPSDYRSLMPAIGTTAASNIMDGGFLAESDFASEYESFRATRAARLAERATELCQLT